jgi:hypothetical protein
MFTILFTAPQNLAVRVHPYLAILKLLAAIEVFAAIKVVF